MIKKTKIILYIFFFLINYLVFSKLEASVENKLSIISVRNPITEYAINSKINMIVFLNHKSIDKNEVTFRRQIMESLIEESLIFKQGEKLNISVTEAEFSKTLSYIIQKAQITQEELLEALNEKIFDKDTLSNFIKYQIMMQQIIQKKIPLELQCSNADKLLIKEKILQKINHENAEYKIMLLYIKNKKVLQGEKFESCAQIEKFIENNNITKQTNDFVAIKNINPSILKLMESTKNDYGIVSNQNEIIAFCRTKSQKKTIDMSNEEIKNIYKNELLLQAIKNNMDNLKKNNFILIKE